MPGPCFIKTKIMNEKKLVNAVLVPGNAYAMSLPKKMTEREAREYMRDWLKVDRLPAGTEFWLTDWKI